VIQSQKDVAARDKVGNGQTVVECPGSTASTRKSSGLPDSRSADSLRPTCSEFLAIVQMSREKDSDAKFLAANLSPTMVMYLIAKNGYIGRCNDLLQDEDLATCFAFSSISSQPKLSTCHSMIGTCLTEG
jgi:hypothetical protein